MHTRKLHTPRAVSPATALAFLLGALSAAALPAIVRTQPAHAAQAPGLANPADDRSRMITELQRLNASIDAIRDTLTSGRVKVQAVQPPKSN